jgi:hypothetical protein
MIKVIPDQYIHIGFENGIVCHVDWKDFHNDIMSSEFNSKDFIINKLLETIDYIKRS